MLELKGKYNTAKVFTDNIDSETISQIINLCNQKSMEKSQIRIMPDCHAGAGCTIGTTITIEDKVIPNLVGVDIGCGMQVERIDTKEVDFEKLDQVIRKRIPSGMTIHEEPVVKDVYCHFLDHIKAPVDIEKAKRSIGTLGGGNHFLELDKDTNGNYWLIIHTGSRHLGLEVARYYQELAYEDCKKAYIGSYQARSEEVIKKLKTENRHNEIEYALKNLQKDMEQEVQGMKIPKELAYLSVQHMEDYLHDIAIVQEMASTNRILICMIIFHEMGWQMEESYETIHNYVDVKHRILRKGSVSAQKEEILVIPINMRDGVLFCKGKGNADWNYSAPHGAGRIMSRGQAKERISMEEFHKSMTDIYTTSVCKSTLDEAPQAYKPMQEIMDNIQDTVVILDVWKPVYNFKTN